MIEPCRSAPFDRYEQLHHQPKISDAPSALVQFQGIHPSYCYQRPFIPSSLCASRKKAKSETSVKGTSCVMLASFFACSITRRSPSSGMLPCALKTLMFES